MKETRGWSQARCCRELGCGINQIKRWRDHGAPLYIALACASISYGLLPSDGLRAEVERLRGIIEKSDSARYLEAVQRACDERLTELKHQAREWQNRAEAAERQLVEARAWISEATRTIIDLSGGGSENFVRRGDEYRADLPFCANRIRDRIDASDRRWLEAVSTQKDVKSQLAEARAALEHDRAAVADGLAAIRKVIAGRSWLRASRGSFAWDDDERYQQEFSDALDEIEAGMQPLVIIAGDWSNCSTDPNEIARARATIQDRAPSCAEGEV